MTEPDANPLAASCYADRAVAVRAEICENVALARDTFRIRVICPEIAARIVPGQFVMIRLPSRSDPLLARPFALYDTVFSDAGEPIGIDVVYLVVGRATSRLSEEEVGGCVEVLGPLGNGFNAWPVDQMIFVAGGIGQTPFLALGRELLGGRVYGEVGRLAEPAKKVTMCYGVRSREFVAGEEDFRACGIDLRISSDDGSVGHHGLVTDLLEDVLRESEGSAKRRRIACCGPEPMLEKVAEIADRAGLPCEVSLETPMACGIGICYSCVTRVRQPQGGWDYKRTCVDGPVFDAAKIEW